MFNLITIAALDTGEQYGQTTSSVISQYHSVAGQLLKLSQQRPPKEIVSDLEDMEELVTREAIVPKVRDQVNRILGESPTHPCELRSACVSSSDAVDVKTSTAMDIQDAAIAALLFLAPPRRSDSYCTIVIGLDQHTQHISCDHRDCLHPSSCRGNKIYHLPAEDRYLIYLTHHKTCRSRNPVSGGPALTYINQGVCHSVITLWLRWRGVLVKPSHDHGRLFCNSKGDVLKPATLQARMGRWSEEVIGQRLTPHSARYILAEFSVRELPSSSLPSIAHAMGHSVAQLKQYALKRSMVSRNLASEAANLLDDEHSEGDLQENATSTAGGEHSWDDIMYGAVPSRKKPHGRPKGYAQKYKRRVRPPVTAEWLQTYCPTVRMQLYALGKMYNVQPPKAMDAKKLLSLLTKPRADDPNP